MNRGCKIDTPIVLIKIKGDLKEKAGTSKYTKAVLYQPHLDETWIVVMVKGIPNKEVFKHLISQYTKTKGIATAEYMEAGINIVIAGLA